MPDAGTIHQQVQARLQELEQLIAPLRAELEQLSSVSACSGRRRHFEAGAGRHQVDWPPPQGRSQAGCRVRAAAAKPARRGGGGGRAQLTAKLISDQPGITASELAKAMSIAPNYLYRVLPRLEREGHIKKQGKGYHPTAAAQSAAGSSKSS